MTSSPGPSIQEQRSHFQRVRAGRREKRLSECQANAPEERWHLSGEAAVTGKLRRGDRGPDVIKFIARRERPIERNADHDELKVFDRSKVVFLRRKK